MRVLNAVRRLLLLLVLIPVVAICLDALLRMFGARPRNPIVSGVRDVADTFILDPFTTVFRDQSPYQDAMVSLVAYGLLALLIVFVFRGLSAMMSARPPSQQGPAKKSASKPAAAPKEQTKSREQTGGSDDTAAAKTNAGEGSSQSSS